MTKPSLVCFSTACPPSPVPTRVCVCVCSCVFLFSHPLGPSQRHIQRERDLPLPGVGRTQGHGRAGRPRLQRGVQEVPARPQPVHALRRQRGHRSAPPGHEAEEGGGEEPAGPHPLQLRGPGRQRRVWEEPVLAQLLHGQHHHQPGRLVITPPSLARFTAERRSIPLSIAVVQAG